MRIRKDLVDRKVAGPPDAVEHRTKQRLCPFCGGVTTVVEATTDLDDFGLVCRSQRRCDGCGGRWSQIQDLMTAIEVTVVAVVTGGIRQEVLQ